MRATGQAHGDKIEKIFDALIEGMLAPTAECEPPHRATAAHPRAQALTDDLKEKQKKIQSPEERQQVLYNRLLGHIHKHHEQAHSTTDEQLAEGKPNTT